MNDERPRAQLSSDGNVPTDALPSDVIVTTDPSGDTVLTVAEGSLAARITTNTVGDTVLTKTGA